MARSLTSLREGERYLRYRGLHGRFAAEGDGPELRELMTAPDLFFARPNVTMLKSSVRSCIARGEIDGREIVVKRIQARSYVKALKRSFVPTPAARAWRASWRLREMGIPTARPIAYVERRYGPFRGRSWEIMEWLPGVDALAFVRDAPTQDLSTVVDRIAILIGRLHDARISHGDNNVRNFVIHEGYPYLIDLDGLFIHPSWSPVYRRYVRRDLRRLLRNWRRHPIMHELLREAFIRHGVGRTAGCDSFLREG